MLEKLLASAFLIQPVASETERLKLDLEFFSSFLANSTCMLGFFNERMSNDISLFDKIALLDRTSAVQDFIEQHSYLRPFLASLTPECEVAFKQVIAIGQAERLFSGVDPSHFEVNKLRELLERLVAMDHFYREMGGIMGYQSKIKELIALAKRTEIKNDENRVYHSPSFIDIENESPEVDEAVSWGVENLALMAEIYPLGGAADRLHLVDEKTNTELPAAKLPFAGKTLLELLIADLQAREKLYFDRFGKQLITPIAIMTSHEKNNHAHVIEICEKLNYFGRPKDSIRFFTQPLVPAVNEKGEWCLTGPLKPVMKPGGHGVIWKLARDSGVFDWFKTLGRKKALVRQINNPIAGLDYGLLAFTGIGCKNNMVFGFASCPRLLQAAEGVNVLIEKDQEVVLTNIEYCDFAKFGIEDLPLKEGEPYSRFSSNTNILFADLEAISNAVNDIPFPGLLINLKKATYTLDSGEKREEAMARLESTMQNIADVFTEEKEELLKTKHTYVTYNRRHKTISTAKKAFVPGKPLQETPENCFYDLLSAHRELLTQCGFVLPRQHSLDEYLQNGPEIVFLYHAGLGPLYSDIRKKIRGGALQPGSELVLEIADVSFSNVCIDGSLQIIAEQPIGHFDENGILHYSDQVGSCILENVEVVNQGVDWKASNSFWKMDLERKESVKIILKGKSKFIARNTRLVGGQTFVLEDGQILEL